MKKSRFLNICTSVAGSVGTGNIVGVALAIGAGGPGAVFWMWISAIAGMIVKAFEVRFGTLYGGPMGYMSGKTAKNYAIIMLIASFGIGNAVQVSAISDAAHSYGAGFLVPLALPALTLLLSLKSEGRGRAIGVLVPVMAIFYLAGAWYVIIGNGENLGTAFQSIFAGAMKPEAVIAGITRGMMSHEAGLGSAAMAHSDGEGSAFDGAFEVFADTVLVSTTTALLILTTGRITALAALETALPYAREFVSISLVMFAYSSVLSWQSYGEKCAEYLGIKKIQYIITFSAAIAPFSLLRTETAVAFSDPVNLALAAVNMYAMMKVIKTAPVK